MHILAIWLSKSTSILFSRIFLLYTKNRQLLPHPFFVRIKAPRERERERESNGKEYEKKRY